jgi:hypothetical protein
MPDINTNKPWSEMDLSDLDKFLTSGKSVEVAEYLCNDVDEILAKIAELRRH